MLTSYNFPSNEQIFPPNDGISPPKDGMGAFQAPDFIDLNFMDDIN